MNATAGESQITVLLPCKDQRPDFLRDAIESVLRQTSAAWTLLIIIYPSTPDDLQSLAHSYERDPRVKVLVTDAPLSAGIAGSLNTGMKSVATEFACILLSDDFFDASAIAVLGRAIHDHPNVDFFHSSRVFTDSRGNVKTPVLKSVESFDLRYFATAGSPVKHLLCWRNSRALAIGGFDPALGFHGCDDYDFPWRMAEAGCRFHAIPEPLYVARIHHRFPRLTTDTPLQLQVETLRRMFAKHGVSAAQTEAYVEKALSGYLRSDMDLDLDPAPEKSAAAPFISVIVPYRNEAAAIDACLNSLERQNYPKDRYEIIAVDNGSTDRGPALAAAHTAVVRLSEPTRGRSRARNRGIESARGEILAFTDADAVADPDWLATLGALFASPDVHVAAGDIRPHQPRTAVEIYVGKLMSQEDAGRRYHPDAAAGNLAVRKTVLDRSGRFDVDIDFGEDTDLSWRLQAHGYSIDHAAGAVIYHRNIDSAGALFRRTFLANFRAQYVRKKNLAFLRKHSRFSRWNLDYYARYLASLAGKIGRRGDRTEAGLDLIFLVAKVSGSLAGSLRYGFFFL